jgi:hypothetical protein
LFGDEGRDRDQDAETEWSVPRLVFDFIGGLAAAGVAPVKVVTD